jgi:hypothetical protein
LTTINHPQWHSEASCQIWFESVHRRGLYRGVDQPETGFDPSGNNI